jgi:hypothetical protein
MTRRTLQGGSYVEAWPTGDFASLIPRSHVETSAGNVPLPEGEAAGLGVIYLRLFVGVGLKLTGQGQNSGIAWLWDGVKWINEGPSYGVSPCAFGPSDGRLYLATPSMGSQGIRFVTPAGVVVTGDQTYYDRALQINEYTTQGDVTIGQGQEGGVIVSYAGMRKRLAEGDCYFVRFNRAGDRLAIAWWTPHQNAAQLVWMNVSEIAKLPDAPLKGETPTPAPQPQPIPEPVPVTSYQPSSTFVDFITRRWNELQVAERVQALWMLAGPEGQQRWKDGNNPQLRTAMADVASHGLFQALAEWAHGIPGRDEPLQRSAYRLYDKPGGTEFHFTGDLGEDVSVSEDVIGILLARGLRAWKDVGGGFGGPEPRLNWGEFQVEPNTDERYIVPPRSLLGAEPAPQPIPVPQPGPTPQPPPSSQLEQRVRELERIVAGMQHRRIALKSEHGKYVAIEPDGRVVADRDAVGAWEVISIEVQP